MKSAIVLSLLAVLCTVDQTISQSVNLEMMKIQIRSAIFEAEGAVRQLEFLRSQTQEDTVEKAQKKSDEEQDNYRSYKSLLLTGIRKEVEAAKASGKKDNNCYEEAIKGIEESEAIARKTSETCVDNAAKSIANNLGFIDNLIWTGRSLTLELDNLFLTCHDSDNLRKESCILAELGRIKAAVKSLESDTNSAKITAVPLSNNVILQAGNCVKKAYAGIYSGSILIKLGVTQCIENANMSTTEPTTESTTKSTTESTTSTYLELTTKAI